MGIRELVERTGVPAKTIRYYEDINLLSPPARKPNGYRNYAEADVERLKLVAGARRMDIPIAEIKEILDLRDRQEPPCSLLLEIIAHKREEIQVRIVQLKRMDAELSVLYDLGMSFPKDDVDGKHCVCHLVSEKANNRPNK